MPHCRLSVSPLAAGPLCLLLGALGAPAAVADGGHPFDADGVLLLSHLTLDELDGAPSGNDCWGYTSPSGREFAIMGTFDGTVFVEVSDPTRPEVVGSIDGPDSDWRDIKVYGDHAYAVSEGGGGIQVIDMTGIDAGQVSLVGSITGPGSDETHNVAIDVDSGFLYRTSGPGLRIYDLQDPATPVHVGSWFEETVHDLQVVTFTDGPYSGKQLAYCCVKRHGAPNSLAILDVTDKQNIVTLSECLYPLSVCAHQGWLSEDRNTFYLGDEYDELRWELPTTINIIDVSDPAAATWKGTFTNGNTAVEHNMYTRGDFLFAASYTAGFRVFDITNPLAPIERAYFDTYPLDDEPEFRGLWGNYPFFDSGIIIASDRSSGLFVLWYGTAPIEYEFPNGVPTSLDPLGESITVQISEDPSGVLVPGSERLVIGPPESQIEVPLGSQGGGAYEAVFPSFPCGTELAWHLVADTTSGIPWTSPPGAPSYSYTSTIGELSNYCSATPNSTGVPAAIRGTGSVLVTNNDFGLSARDCPPSQFGLFFYGPEPADIPFGNGVLCVGEGAIGHFRLEPPASISASGSVSRAVDTSDPPELAAEITPGSTWYFQFWYRDPSAGGSEFNLSDGLRVVFCP